MYNVKCAGVSKAKVVKNESKRHRRKKGEKRVVNEYLGLKRGLDLSFDL